MINGRRTAGAPSQCAGRILNKISKAINETYAVHLRGSEYILYEILELRAQNPTPGLPRILEFQSKYTYLESLNHEL